MKRNLLVFVLLLSSAGLNAQSYYPGGIPGVIARYTFNSLSGTTLTDVSSNGNHGTTYSALTANSWRGIANGSIKFDGISGYALVPNSSSLISSNLTMIALVRFDGFWAGSCQISQILSKGYPAYQAGVYGMGITDNVYDNNCATTDSLHQMRSDYVGGNSVAMPQSAVVQKGNWYMMAATFDSAAKVYKTYQLLMDPGSMYTSVAPLFTINNVPNGLGANTEPISIGKHMNASYPYMMNGAMDELVLFNRALTEAEIYQVYYFLYNGYALSVNEAETRQSRLSATTSNGRLNIQSLDGKGIGNVMLYNLHGQVLMSIDMSNSVGVIDISDLPKEVLFARIARSNGTCTLKVSNL